MQNTRQRRLAGQNGMKKAPDAANIGRCMQNKYQPGDNHEAFTQRTKSQGGVCP